jgi:hypothetical protein
MLEIVRRVVLLTFVLAAVWMALNPAPALLRVGTIGFAREQQADRRRSFGFDSKVRLPLDQYIVEKTSGRLMEVRGKSWIEFYGALLETTQGRSSDHKWRSRLGSGFLREYVFFRPDEQPLSSIAKELGSGKPFIYLLVAGEESPRYLGITYCVPKDASGYAPAYLLYPLRQYSLWLLFAGLILYIFLPWPKHPPEAVVCSRRRAVVLPDFLGLVLCAVFFGLPLFIITRNSPEPGVLNFNYGWGFLTLILWTFALAWLTILAFSTWYSKYQIHLLKDRLRKVTLRNEKDYLFAEMASVRPIEWRPPRWLITLGFIVSLLNWRAVAPTLMLMGESHNGISIYLKGSRAVDIWLNPLEEGKRILEALREAGVPMEGFAELTSSSGRVRNTRQ